MVEPSPTVYSYYAPEVERVVNNALARLSSYAGDQGVHHLLRQNIEPGLDELHLPVMEKYERFARSEGVIGLEDFDSKYFTGGSSEAIFHLIAGLLPAEPLYQFDGEYQGYQGYANAIGREIITVNPRDYSKHPPGILIASNPASRNGNRISGFIVKEWAKHHKVILDLAYLGMTREPLNLDLTDDNIVAVVGSLSKSFGLYYYRIGFCYSKWPIQSLYANKWFKNALSIKIGEAVLDHFANPETMQKYKDKYFGLQERAVQRLNNLYNLDNRLAGSGARRAQASDVWMLAYAPLRDFDPADLQPFKRGEQNYRFCLTPYYMEPR